MEHRKPAGGLAGLVVVCGVLVLHAGLGRSADARPPLAAGTVTVGTEPALQAAVAALTSDQTIVIRAGRYRLSGTLALPQGLTNVTLKGATGNPADVVLQGAGMEGSIDFGIWVGAVSKLVVQGLTLQGFHRHGIILNEGAQQPRFSTLAFIDVANQFLKINPRGINGGVVEDSTFAYTTTAPPDCYTNGVDLHNGAGWTIRRNTFTNIRCKSALAGPAVLVWDGSRDTLISDNTFTNNQRDIAAGFDDTKPAQPPVSNPTLTDHAGGSVTRNIITRSGAVTSGDVGISVADSPNTTVTLNTVRLNGSYPNAIEYRFRRTTGVTITDNTIDGLIVARDGATATLARNGAAPPPRLPPSPGPPSRRP